MEWMVKMEPKANQVHKAHQELIVHKVHKVKEDLMGHKVSPGPSGVVNASNAYVVWNDNTLGNFEIFFRASQGLGTINVSNNTALSFNQQIAAIGNNVYVTWEDETPGNRDVFFAASTNNGTSFATPINLSNNTGKSQLPQIAAIGNNVYVTWSDNTL